MIDAHIHLDQYSDSELERLIPEWKSQGVSAVVAVSNNIGSAQRTLQLKAKYPTFIYAAVGYHPEQSPPSEADVQALVNLIDQQHEHISAIGEVGLPHYQLPELGKQALGTYTKWLSEFAFLARQRDLPIVVHAVHDKAIQAFDILNHARIDKAHFHWLKAPVEVVQRIVDRGYFISVTPEVVYRERDQQLVQQIPLSQLLLETDGPWQYAGAFSNRKTTPLFLFDMLNVVAQLKGISTSALARQLIANTKQLFDKRSESAV